jgi:preprotein translocase subunit SecG
VAPKRHAGSSPAFRTKDFFARFNRTVGKAYNMQILFYFVVIVHVLVCFFLIGVVLLQQGRSADLAGAFGGQGSQTAFGPRAAANVLTRLTTWSAVIFMCTSIGLVVLFMRSTTGSHSVTEGTSAPISTPANSGK